MEIAENLKCKLVSRHIASPHLGTHLNMCVGMVQMHRGHLEYVRLCLLFSSYILLQVETCTKAVRHELDSGNINASHHPTASI
jgi:hypothetical protein